MASDDPSLVPGQIPPTLMHRVITTAGENGENGSIYPSVNGTALYGQDGLNGQNATSPSEGRSGQDIEIYLNYESTSPAFVQVISEEHGDLEVSSHEVLFLDAHGGNGGNGGHGEAGQNGGAGYDGANATLYTIGQDGGRGGSGGNGGYGTNGANGGRGGDVFTTVGEHDLDLLLAVDYNIKGGSGGDAGKHGAPGKGGAGGKGGGSFSGYTDDSQGGRSRVKNPGGSQGLDGPAGLPPTTYLSSGHSGEDGSISINIAMDNNTVRSYESRYQLVVDSFEVVDENNDGINEPGEYLIVKNIIVRNEGFMPSPSGQLLNVVIRESLWLKPDTAAPLILPDGIMPNRQASIPGQLKALIRHEKTPRESGEVLNSRDTVSLIGYSPRLRRSIPEFSGGVPIIVQYPLELTPPAYMDCMEKSDEMTVSWTVNNVSTIIYGHGSVTNRATRTKLIDTGQNFVLESAAEELNFMEDVIDQIQSTTGSSFGETFTVANDTQTFSTGSFLLELHLSDPHSAEMRRIMHYRFDIQISEGYRFNYRSQFLLLVNASTDNQAITQLRRFIQSQLYLEVDTLNLSLTGSLIDEQSGISALQKYTGKSIIVSGNPFTYFSQSTRYNWDLIDPRDALMLLMNQTSFMFCGVLSQNDQNSLARWASLVKYPAELGVESADSLMEHNCRRTLLEWIRTEPSPDSFTMGFRNQYALNSKSGILSIFRNKLDKRLQANGHTLSRKLGKQTPMRRFVVTSLERGGEVPEPSTGIISVVEGLSRSASCTVSRLSIVDSLGMVTPHQAVMIIASIPFRILAAIFWNIIRSVNSNGVSTEAMYRNLSTFYTPLNQSGTQQYDGEVNQNGDGGQISYQVCKAVAWAVEHALDSDIQQLCSSNGTVIDLINKKSILTHTPRVHQFLNEIPKDDSITASKQGINLAVQVLGTMTAALRSSNIIIDLLSSTPGFPGRRAKLRRKVSKYNSDALSFMGSPSLVKDIKRSIKKERKNLGKELRLDTTTPRVAQNIIRRKLATLTRDSPHGFVDVAAAEEGSIYLDPNSFQTHQSAYAQLLHQQRTDGLHAGEMREEIIASAYTAMDYLPLTSFN